MIREVLTYLSESPTQKSAKKLGHLTESISLLARETRCKKAWTPHRTMAKNFIIQELSKAQNFESVLVLGSGPLHEIPIEELAKTFKRVVLVDIVHLKNTKKAVAHLKNIEFVEHDISEIEEALTKGQLLKKIPTSFLTENWGLVISANIMSQLPIHLETYIKKHFSKKFNSEEIKSYLEAVTKNHWLYLEKFQSTVLLFTDTQAIYSDKKDQVLEIDENYSHLNLPQPHLTWTWNVAPIPEFHKDIAIKMQVAAFILKNPNSH